MTSQRRQTGAGVRRGFTAMAAGMLLFVAAGCGQPAFIGAAKGEFPLAEKAERPSAVKSFKKLFDTHCQGCHGPNGKNGAAPPLNDPLFLAIVPKEELKRVITNGRKYDNSAGGRRVGEPSMSQDTMMPAFARSNGGPLTDEQIDILVQNLHDPGENMGWSKPASIEGVPPYIGTKKGNAEDGAGVFAMNCASCHGENGKGGQEGSLNDPAFLALTSDQLLRRIVITGRPDFGMPNFRTRERKDFKPLTDQDVADVVAYVASWRKSVVPSGSTR
jgi:mono/diheme cytochrome c family protein